MTDADRLRYLRIALFLVGLIFLVGVYPLTLVWPSGWAWHTEGTSLYLEMILGVYATLGVFLIRASRDPLAHRGDVAALFIVAIVFAVLMPRAGAARSAMGAPSRA